jgi:hypothetical protein
MYSECKVVVNYVMLYSQKGKQVFLPLLLV